MDMDKPLRGVFSTRSPVRPNTIGVTRVRLVSREGLTIVVEGLDAFEGTAIIDIKEGGGTRHAI
jgi:tRNA (Thr-GGU) A37 N-methylase